jgi:WD40 repeat protein
MEVLAIDIQRSNNYLISLSEDLTIRIWNISKREQVYEFSFPKEDKCLTISAHPSKLFFAGGFMSGCLRIFDIEKMCISEELSFYADELKKVKYSPDGKLLLGVNGRGLYTIFDTERNYAVINQIEIDFPSEF